MYSPKPLFIMIRIHTLMFCDDWGNGWSDLYVELLTKNNVRINELYFSKRPLLSFRSQKNSCNCHHHFEYAVIELSSFSRTPDRFSFPRRVQAYQFPITVAAVSCYLTLLPLQNTGFRFSFSRTLLADRRSFFLSLTWARISSSLLVSLLLYKENKNCDECNRRVMHGGKKKTWLHAVRKQLLFLIKIPHYKLFQAKSRLNSDLYQKVTMIAQDITFTLLPHATINSRTTVKNTSEFKRASITPFFI